ncbi:MAG TPA: CHRD domain-containing protein [Stellaceae bacterium]|nr:CHRD domain-containing protein [Stellaceae bacterium]
MVNTIPGRVLVAAACLSAVAMAASARAAPTTIDVKLTPSNCVPPVETSATGTADLTYDPATRKVTWTVHYSGLSSPATMAHFHGPGQPGKNASVVIWLTTRGTPPHNPITGEATLTPEQAQQFTAGEWYVNLHTRTHPACELRGQVPPLKS